MDHHLAVAANLLLEVEHHRMVGADEATPFILMFCKLGPFIYVRVLLTLTFSGFIDFNFAKNWISGVSIEQKHNWDSSLLII